MPDPPSSQPPPFDPERGEPRGLYDLGMQQERTALAWDRTALAMIVGGALFVRTGDLRLLDLRHLPGTAMLVLGAFVLGRSYRQYERRDVRVRRGGPALQPRMAVVVGVAAVVFSLASAVLVLSRF
jgi:uncharacterized membrane protein YidH (DUF202 family)